MSAWRQLARCIARELPSAGSMAMGSAATSARAATGSMGASLAAAAGASSSMPCLLQRAMAGTRPHAAGTLGRACQPEMTTLQRSIFGAASVAGSNTSKASQTQAKQAPFDTMHLEKGLAAPSGSLSEAAHQGAATVPAEEEEDDEGVLPYIPQHIKKLSRLKSGSDHHAVEHSSSSSSSSSAQGPAVVDSTHQHQQLDSPRSSITKDELRFLMQRFNQLRLDKQLTKVKVGKAGLTPSTVAHIQELLRKHEFLRVEFLATSRIHPKHAAPILPDLLDSVTLRVTGLGVEMFRDKNWPEVKPTAELLEKAVAIQRPLHTHNLKAAGFQATAVRAPDPLPTAAA